MKTIEDRFWEKVEKTEGCWNWTAAKNQYGYGIFAITKKDLHPSHRFAYQLAMGDIPAGMQVDHICRNRACLRIEHLRIVTPAQNCQNLDAHRDNKSGHRGVSWYTRSNKWRVRVSVRGRDYVGGMFDDLEEAAEAAKALRNSVMTHNAMDRMATK